MNLLKSTAIAFVLSATTGAFSADTAKEFDAGDQAHVSRLKEILSSQPSGKGAPARARLAAQTIEAEFSNLDAVAEALNLSSLTPSALTDYVRNAEAGDETSFSK